MTLSSKSAKQPPTGPKPETKKDRLAKALKQNLLRRKAAAPSRKSG